MNELSPAQIAALSDDEWIAYEDEHNVLPPPIEQALIDAIEAACDGFARREARHPDLSSLPYREYLRSEHWQELRRRKLARAGGICLCCRREDAPLDVHHLTYARLGQERESDLMVLCRSCHYATHDLLDQASDPDSYSLDQIMAHVRSRS